MTSPGTMPVRTAAFAVLAGALGSYALVGGSPGIGFPLTALAVAVTVALALPSAVTTPHSLGLGVLSLVLVSLSAVRDAEWLVVLNVMAALGTAAVAVAGADTWQSIFYAPLRALRNSFASPPGIIGALVGRVGPEQRRHLRPVMRGSVIGLLLLFVFGTLFVSADRAFAQIAGDIFSPEWDASLLPARLFVGLLVMAMAGGLATTLSHRGDLATLTAEEGDPFAAPKRAWRERIGARSEWIVPLALLDLLFIAFVAVQVTVLFAGREHVLRSADVTYADYARSGFFQLLAVAFLTLVVVAIAATVTRPAETADRMWLRTLLGILCVCTLVILVSAFQRLLLYEETYGFTRLRITVHATILWLAVIFGLVIGAGVRMKAGWLPRVAVTVTAIGLVVFTLFDPDAVIAEQNVKRFEAQGKIDVLYLRELSSDALPALMALPDEELSCVLPAFRARLADDEPWTSANLARARARSALERAPHIQGSDCSLEGQIYIP